jgi:drug/metabolite transporter (DMT)-like permease
MARSNADPVTIPRTRRWGIALATATAVISGFAVFLNGYGVVAWKDAGFSTSGYTTVKNLVAAALLMGLFAAMGRSRRVTTSGHRMPRTRSQWAGLVAVGVIGGSVPFLLFFEGLARASSTQAALLHKTLIIWVAILAVPLLKERLSAMHLVAIGLLIAGQVALAGGVSNLAFGSGEWMVLGATLMWSVEVVLAKRLLGDLSSSTVGAARMGIGVVVLIGYGVVTGAFAEIALLGGRQWLWVLATGAILSAYVATWYAGLARAQAVDVTAVLVLGAVITALLRAWVQGAPAPSAVGSGLVTVGALLVIGLGLSWGSSRERRDRLPVGT